MNNNTERRPGVSIILPTYNRAKFLPQAFASIREQTYTDWELIVVDDGSTDETAQVLPDLLRQFTQPCHYAYQTNQGPYAARNKGLDMATESYIAFYDSDDYWLPHHLTDCVRSLEAHPEVDWVYGACKIVDWATKKEIADNTFYHSGQPRPFLKLRHRIDGPLHIIEDEGVIRCALLHGLYCGLQNSVMRRELFLQKRFIWEYRNEAEDQLIVLRILASGGRFAYLNNIHVIYHVHNDNSSAASATADQAKRVRIYQALLRGFQELYEENLLKGGDQRALARRLGSAYFWQLGYALHWQHGEVREALKAFERGLRYWPWDWRMWKTYLLARLRLVLRIHNARQDKSEFLGLRGPSEDSSILLKTERQVRK